jgi:hypothetical protein
MPDEPETILPKPGDTASTRVGMEEGDNTDTPATGLDPEQQGDDQAVRTSDTE